MKLIIAIASLLVSLSALAAPPERHIVFQPDQIDVERLGPLIDPIRVLRPADTGSLIQVRTSFAREIVQSVDAL